MPPSRESDGPIAPVDSERAEALGLAAVAADVGEAVLPPIRRVRDSLFGVSEKRLHVVPQQNAAEQAAE